MAQANTGSTGNMSRTGAQNATGTPDATYNLISILYHALQGAETYEQYIRDAQQRGNNDLAQFFQEVQQQDARRAQRGRELLARCLQQGQADDGRCFSPQDARSKGNRPDRAAAFQHFLVSGSKAAFRTDQQSRRMCDGH